MMATFSCVVYIVETYVQELPPDVPESWEEWEESEEAKDWESLATRFTLMESIVSSFFMLNFAIHFYVSDQVSEKQF